MELFLDCRANLRRELDVVVEALYLPFHFPDEDVARFAVAHPAVPAGADEVGIDRPILFLRVADEHPLAAKGAVDSAFQEVGMLVVTFSVDA
nr:hypothetical protein [Olegusella massiliensis]